MRVLTRPTNIILRSAAPCGSANLHVSVTGPLLSPTSPINSDSASAIRRVSTKVCTHQLLIALHIVFHTSPPSSTHDSPSAPTVYY